MLSPTSELIDELRAAGGQPTNLFSAVQRLALEVAARTMFSLEMRQNSPALRDFVVRYGQKLGRTHVLDLLLPLRVPSPYDMGRSWFRRRWMRFFEQLMEQRRRSGASAEQP